MRGFKDGDPISCNLFNFVVDSVLRKAGVHCNCNVYQTSFQSLTYSDIIDSLGHTKRDVTSAFSAIERESTKMGPAVNKAKTKYMLSASKDVLRLRQINIPLIQSKMIVIWRSKAESVLPMVATMVLIRN